VRSAALAAAGLLVTLALAACGVGAKSSSSAPTTSAPAGGAGTSSAGTGSGTETSGAGTGTTGATTTAMSTGATSTTTSSGSARAGHRHGKHATNALPTAPAGLSQTAGYATYERCQGTCTGSVPLALRRPLKLPTEDGGPCPITLNPQPAFAGRPSAGLGFHGVSGSQWQIAEVTWSVPGSYTGPLLIRGAMLGGGVLGFGTRPVPYDELQVLDAGRGAPRVVGDGRAWVTYTRVQSGGCYAYQVDGSSFSEVVVFRAVA
jgi:hypothetical protein